MDFEKLTYKSKDVIEAVVNLAAANKNQYITPLHLLKVLLDGKNELIREKCIEAVKHFDEYGFWENEIIFVFTSRQTLTEKYGGSVQQYFRR